MTQRILTITNVSIEKLRPFENNARIHTDGQIAEIAASIREFGFVSPILADPDGTIIAGHGRVLAARQINMLVVPVIYIDGLSEPQRRALTLVDNRLAEKASYNLDILSAELKTLDSLGFDVDDLGFGRSDLDELFETSGPNNLSDLEDAEESSETEPELAPEPATKATDLSDSEHPVLKLDLRLPAEVMERYESLMHQAPGRQAWEKFDAILSCVDVSALSHAGGAR